MPKLQERVIELLADIIDGSVDAPSRPEWLQKPTRLECGPLWETVCKIYSALEPDLVLPEKMPDRERREVDAVLCQANGIRRIIEVDESQHFNPFRATTLHMYPERTKVAFPRDVWIAKSTHGRKLPGGGWGKPKPPLFPADGGRHRQRVFRDTTADLLPAIHGFAPTLRLAYFEVEPWIWGTGAMQQLRDIVDERLTGN